MFYKLQINSSVYIIIIISYREIKSLQSELHRVSTSSQSATKQCLNFQSAMQHFICLEERQAQERQNNTKIIAQMQGLSSYFNT
jgi:hypothetical protein